MHHTQPTALNEHTTQINESSTCTINMHVCTNTQIQRQRVSTQQEMLQTKELKRETTLQKPTQTSLLDYYFHHYDNL